MPIHFRCPHCDKLLAIGTRRAGTQLPCPLCTRPITVPPRTEVSLPPTTVVPPELAHAWWLDAPPADPSPATPDSEPATPPPPGDAWWVTTPTSSPPAESAVTATPPAPVPPPLPETIQPDLPGPTADVLLFESPTLSPPAEERPPPDSAPSGFTSLHLFLVLGAVVVSLLAVSVLVVLLRGSESSPATPAAQAVDGEKKDDNPAPAAGDSGAHTPSAPRRERTEDELRQEAAGFPELSLDRGHDRSEPQSLWLQAATAEREGKPLDAGPLWLPQRSDLAGLPIRAAKECTLDAATARQLQTGALALRAQLFAAGRSSDGPPDARKLREALSAPGEQGNKWLRPAAVPALQQLLMAEDASLRQVLVEQLARIDGPRASAMLARNALFDLDTDVRKSACTALAKRPREEYQKTLLEGFRYPWLAVVDHAAEALVALGRREVVPELVSLLDQPSPAEPHKKLGGEKSVVREVVRVNHLRNCALCHAPSLKESDTVRGFVPPADQPLPPPFTREYYAGRRPGRFVRADVTYLQQDFSVPLPVADPGKWPKVQRFDFLVRERPATDEEQKTAGKAASAYQQAILFALRELTGADAGSTAEDWKRWAKRR